MRGRVAVLLALTLAACNDSPPFTGTVIDRDYEPEHNGMTSGGVGVGTDGKVVYVAPQSTHSDAQWILVVQDQNGKLRTAHVSEAVYYSCDIGETFDSSTKRCK